MILLKALLFMNAFSLVLGVLIVFMDRVLSSYGPCRITINDDKEFEAKGGRTLLRTLLEAKYFIPSACGGKGTCGYCKVRVAAGGGAPLATEALILKPAEIRQGYRLACQLKVKNDLRIHLPTEYLEIREYAGEIALSEPVTSDIRRIRIRLPAGERLACKPGQYIQVRIDHEGGTDFRAYSVASSPDETEAIEINVKKIPNGLGSVHLHSLGTGSQVGFSGPYGDFFLRTDSHRKIVCVAGGVGLAPLKAIVLYWKEHCPDRRLELYYGARSVKDLYDHEVFTHLAQAYPTFAYHPALSAPGPDWQGSTGFIHTVLAAQLNDGPDSEAYLCGPPIMIDAVTGVLLQKGVPAERIWYDKF